jgi:hypothetical protein
LRRFVPFRTLNAARALDAIANWLDWAKGLCTRISFAVDREEHGDSREFGAPPLSPP